MSSNVLGVVMNIPTLATLTLVLAYPIFYAAYLSMHKVALAELRRGIFPFVGFDNYRRILSDPLFLLSLKNTLIFTAFSVTVEIVLAVAIALLIDQAHVWTSRVTKFLILLPYAVPPIANGLIWSFIYNFDFGFLNRILFTLHFIDRPINWVGNPNTALFALAVPYIWRTLPFAILLVHAALQGIDQPRQFLHRQPERARAGAALPDAEDGDSGVGVPAQAHAAGAAAHVEEDLAEPGQRRCVRR